MVTVQAVDTSGNPLQVSSNTTVDPFGNGYMFFSDPSCMNQVSTVTIPSGSSSANFYFEAQATNPLAVSAAGATGANQTETVNVGNSITGFTYTNTAYTGDPNTFGDNGFFPDYLSAYNGTLYIGYNNNGAGTDGILVSAYNGNDASPSWTLTNSGSSIAYSSTTDISPALITYNGLLYATWTDTNGTYTEIRVKSFDGTTWSAADNGSLNFNSSENATHPGFGIYNGNLYVTWDENGLVHVAKYNGGTSWSFIDDNGSGGTNGTFMNYNSSKSADFPVLWGTASGLFAAWYENSELRIKIFNGTSWSAADPGAGIQTTSINYWAQANQIASFATIQG